MRWFCRQAGLDGSTKSRVRSGNNSPLKQRKSTSTLGATPSNNSIASNPLTANITSKADYDNESNYSKNSSGAISTETDAEESKGKVDSWEETRENIHLVWLEIVDVMTNKHFLFLFIAFTLFISSLNAILTVFNQILLPYGYT